MLRSANQYHFISAPRAKGTEPGHAVTLDVSGVAAVLDLRTVTPQVTDAKSANKTRKTPALDAYVTILADGADVGIIFATDLADVTGANVPLIGQAGAVDADGVYTPHVKECYVIKSGTEKPFLLRVGQDNFLGFVGSGAGKMRLYQSSPAGL